MSPPSGPLVAVTTRLDADVDLLAVAGEGGVVFEEGGTGLAGRGTALRLGLPAGPGRLGPAAEVVAGALDSIHRRDEVGLAGCGPVAFASLPFADAAPASAVIPSTVVGRSGDGTRWLTTVAPADQPIPRELPPPPPSRPEPASYRVTASVPPTDWAQLVTAAVELISARAAEKVVLAREVVVETDMDLPVANILARLRAAHPSAMVFAIDGLVGASPELLVSRLGDVVRSHPMAGTTARTGDPVGDARRAAALLAAPKDRAEHQVTIDAVVDAVLPFCSWVDSEPEPRVVPLANVAHLASLVEGRLSSPPASALALVAALHPTPAVCGWPRPEALALMAELESLDRGRYAGPVGWMDAAGNGRFAVAIRCAQIDGRRARLYAGNGIVADSDPLSELAETRAKLQAMLGAVIRP